MVRVATLILLFVLALASFALASPVSLSGVLEWKADGDAPAQVTGHWDSLHPFASRREPPSRPPAVYILQREGEPLPVAGGSVELVIDNLVFSRRALAVRSNTILNISNRSRYALTLQLLNEARNPVDGLLIAPDGTGRLSVPEQGVYILQALEFSHLYTTVVVTPHGRELVIDATGRFSLDGIAPGRYRLLLWAGRWVEGKPFELPAGGSNVTVLTEARAGAVVAVTVRVAQTVPAAAPPVPPKPEAPPVAAPPPRPPSPPTPPVPRAPAPVPAQEAPAKGESASEKKPQDSKTAPKPASGDPPDDGGFFIIREID